MKKTTIHRIKKFVSDHLAIIVVVFVALLCAIFALNGTPAEDGSITLDGNNAKIEDYTKDFIKSSKEALNRIMNEDAPTDDALIDKYDVDEVGLGFHTSLEDILARRLPDGNTDNGKGWQCSKYTAYLATGRREYSSVHPDYGPVNGKDIAGWLIKNYGFKYIDKPVPGAIGSAGFNTKYGHTAMYVGDDMVNDANYVPLTVATHKDTISNYVWVVPGDYNPDPEPTPTPTPTPTPVPQPVSDCKTIQVKKGDTMGAIMKRCKGKAVWGQVMNEYADKWISKRTGKTVFYGWTHGTGYGLIAGDTIVYSE